jgi:hypothetical protein
MNPASPSYIGQFDAAYIAHQPTLVQHLMSMPVDGPTPSDLAAQFQARNLAAQGLQAQGYQIDSIIMIYGWDPYWAMFYRQQWGITANYLGTTTPVKISTNISDFPPYVIPPAPPAPPASTSLVGADLGNGFYGVAPGADVSGLSDGQPYNSDPRGVFIFHRATNPMGTSQWFTMGQVTEAKAS